MNAMQHPIMVVEDSDEDYEVLVRTLKSVGVKSPVERFTDGADILKLFFPKQSPQLAPPRPATIILDLNLPDVDGREVLERFKTDARTKHIPILVLTTSSNPKDVAWCYQQGANAYAVKPVDLPKLEDFLTLFVQFWLGHLTLPDVEEPTKTWELQ